MRKVVLYAHCIEKQADRYFGVNVFSSIVARVNVVCSKYYRGLMHLNKLKICLYIVTAILYTRLFCYIYHGFQCCGIMEHKQITFTRDFSRDFYYILRIIRLTFLLYLVSSRKIIYLHLSCSFFSPYCDKNTGSHLSSTCNSSATTIRHHRMKKY